jgi:hypothetical protein
VLVSVSSEVLPQFREYERFNTTALHAYIGPLMDSYLTRLETRLREQGFKRDLHIRTSTGGIATAARAPRLPVSRTMWRLRALAVGLAVAILLILVSGSFYTVAEYERAVLTTWGEFRAVVEPGLHFKLPVAQAVRHYPVNIQQVTIEQVNTYTIDNQELDATVTIFYRLPAEQLESIYRNVPDYEERVAAISIDRFSSGWARSIPGRSGRRAARCAAVRSSASFRRPNRSWS